MTEYKNVIPEHAAGAAGERLVFGVSQGRGSPDQEYSDWGLMLYLWDIWNEAAGRPALRFSEADLLAEAVQAAQDWLCLEPHLQLFHYLRCQLETRLALTSEDCETVRRIFLVGELGPARPSSA